MNIPTGTWIIIGASFLFSIVIFGLVWRRVSPMLKSAKGMMDGIAADNQLRVTGKDGEATVLVLAPTTMTINQMPVVELTLEVKPSHGAVYQVTLKTPIHQVHLPRVQPNQTVPVKIDPNNPEKVVLAL